MLVALVEGDKGMIAFPTQRDRVPSRVFPRPTALSKSTLTATLDAEAREKVTLIGKATRPPDLVITGSHCVALDVVLGRLSERGFATRKIALGSQGGVTAARRGECDLAPVHLMDPATGTYNKHLLAPGLSLVPGWQRMQGFVHRPDDPRFKGKKAEEAPQDVERSRVHHGQSQRRCGHAYFDRSTARGRQTRWLR